MHKRFEVDMTALTTSTEISTFISEKLAEFSHLFTTSINSSGYLIINPINLDYYISYCINPKGLSTRMYYYTNGTTSYSSSNAYTINGNFFVDIYTNEENETFTMFFDHNYYHRFCVTKDSNGKKQLMFGYDVEDVRIKAPDGNYAASNVFYRMGCSDTSKCYLFNVMKRSGYKIFGLSMIDTFNAALPVYLRCRNTCTIDGEKYVVFEEPYSSSYCNVILFKYTE